MARTGGVDGVSGPETRGERFGWGRYRRGVQTSVLDNASAFGFSITITGTLGTLSTFRGQPTFGEILAFVVGAAVAFSLVQALASGGFRHRLEPHSSDVVLKGTALNFLSVAIALAGAAVVSYFIPGYTAWPAAAFLASLLYVGAEGGELAWAEARRERSDTGRGR
jgi:hypothetical protein